MPLSINKRFVSQNTITLSVNNICLDNTDNTHHPPSRRLIVHHWMSVSSRRGRIFIKLWTGSKLCHIRHNHMDTSGNVQSQQSYYLTAVNVNNLKGRYYRLYGHNNAPSTWHSVRRHFIVAKNCHILCNNNMIRRNWHWQKWDSRICESRKCKKMHIYKYFWKIFLWIFIIWIEKRIYNWL